MEGFVGRASYQAVPYPTWNWVLPAHPDPTSCGQWQGHVVEKSEEALRWRWSHLWQWCEWGTVCYTSYHYQKVSFTRNIYQGYQRLVPLNERNQKTQGGLGHLSG